MAAVISRVPNLTNLTIATAFFFAGWTVRFLGAVVVYIEDAGGASPAAPWEFDVASQEPLGLSGAS